MPISLTNPLEGKGSGSPAGPLPGTQTAVPGGVETVLEYNGLYLNVLNNIDRYKVKTMDGFDDADVRDSREDNPGDDGETAFPSYYSGRPMSLQGTIQAYTLFKMRDMIQALEEAFRDIRQEYPLIIHGRSSAQNVFINCKKNSKLVIQEAQNDMRYFRDFMIPLRASNPRILSLDRPAGQASAFGAAAAIVLTLVNNGSFPAQCEVMLTGGMTAPRITNVTNGTMVKFEPTVVMAQADVRQISSLHNNKFVEDGAGNNKYNEITLDSTWLTLEPGSNQIEFQAAAVSGLPAARTLTFYWRHTWK